MRVVYHIDNSVRIRNIDRIVNALRAVHQTNGDTATASITAAAMLENFGFIDLKLMQEIYGRDWEYNGTPLSQVLFYPATSRTIDAVDALDEYIDYLMQVRDVPEEPKDQPKQYKGAKKYGDLPDDVRKEVESVYHKLLTDLKRNTGEAVAYDFHLHPEDTQHARNDELLRAAFRRATNFRKYAREHDTEINDLFSNLADREIVYYVNHDMQRSPSDSIIHVVLTADSSQRHKHTGEEQENYSLLTNLMHVIGSGWTRERAEHWNTKSYALTPHEFFVCMREVHNALSSQAASGRALTADQRNLWECTKHVPAVAEDLKIHPYSAFVMGRVKDTDQSRVR